MAISPQLRRTLLPTLSLLVAIGCGDSGSDATGDTDSATTQTTPLTIAVVRRAWRSFCGSAMGRLS